MELTARKEDTHTHFLTVKADALKENTQGKLQTVNHPSQTLPVSVTDPVQRKTGKET